MFLLRVAKQPAHMKKFVFYLALTLMVMAASLSPQIPKENNNLVKITQVAKKGKKKQDMPTL
jgi:hypothetical protein